MSIPKLRAKVTHLGDRFIDLYERRAEACGQEDWHRVRRLEDEINVESRFATIDPRPD